MSKKKKIVSTVTIKIKAYLTCFNNVFYGTVVDRLKDEVKLLL